MIDYSDIKQSIATNLPDNNNREITAAKLRSTLNEFVDKVETTETGMETEMNTKIARLENAGYFYAGIATPDTNPNTPDAKVFYIADGKGTYTNFGGISVTEDEVVILYYDTAWHKELTGIASNQKLSELGEKVDALALGEFYGYYPDSSSLPIDVTTRGYAYVGLDNPYKIWNFNGASWSDSGTSIDMNDADEEDITRNADGKLQFKDRAYGDGMGYVILRKDKTFAEQVTQANTIYEIRYNFDLGSTSVTIPNGCVLTFNGGMISNGTLNGDDFRVVADLVKVFNGVTFTGNCIKNIYELDWFVGNKNSFCDLTSAKKDSTAEVQAAFDSGVMNLHISNQFYYYISSTLVIKSWVSLVGNEISVTHYRKNTQGEPSFYTDQTITILKVLGDSDSNNKVQKEIILDNVHFRHCGAIGENDYHMDIPVILITNGTGVNSQVWGVNLNVNISVEDKNISSLGAYMFGYTGIEIYADNNFYFSYITINGRIYNCRRGVYLHASTEGSSWITDARLGFDSTCVWGGQIDAAPVRLTGSHQPVPQLTEQEVNDNPYYFRVFSGVSTAMIWDLGAHNTSSSTPLYSVKSAFYANMDFYDLVTDSNLTNPEDSTLPPGNNFFRWEREKEWQIISMGSNILEKVFHNVKGWQIQDNVASGLTGGLSSNGRGKLESVRAYNSNNEYIDLTEDDVKNFSKLFCLSYSPNFNASNRYFTSNVCTLSESLITQGYNKLETCFVFDRDGVLSAFTSHSYLVAIPYYKSASEPQSIYVDIEFCDSSDKILATKRIQFNNISMYYTNLYLRKFDYNNFVEKPTEYSYVRLRFRDFNTLTSRTPIAKFGIITNAASDATISVSGGEIGGPLVLRNVKYDLNNANNGCRYEHNMYINKAIGISTKAYTRILNINPYFMQPAYVLLMMKNGGMAVITLEDTKLTCSDPSIDCKLEVHTDISDGRYLLSVRGSVDEEIVIYSVFSDFSIRFIDVNEAHESGYFDKTFTLDSIKTNGPTSARPTLPATGQTFFDTTLGKMIVYNGAAWVNMDGAALLVE